MAKTVMFRFFVYSNCSPESQCFLLSLKMKVRLYIKSDYSERSNISVPLEYKSLWLASLQKRTQK